MAGQVEENVDLTIANATVVTKYQMAGTIVNACLTKLIEMCVEGSQPVDICQAGDDYLTTKASEAFRKDKEMRRGVAFPTCISVNNIICHFSPLKNDPVPTLKLGDVVKIDLGAHIDGFIAVAAYTLVVGASKDSKVTGAKANAILAAHYASEIALRLVRPGLENYGVTDAVQKVAETFNCKPIQGMLSHQLKQFRIDGEKSIIQNPNEAQRKEHDPCKFEQNEVYAVDVLISTGEGKGKEQDAKATTVFKKTDQVYLLKLKTSRAVYSEIDKKFGPMPFSLRSLEHESKAKVGANECVTHKLLEPFVVLQEKEGEFVTQFKFTVLLTPTRSVKITGLPVDVNLYQSEHSIQDEGLKNLLNSSISNKKKKNKGTTGAGEGEEEVAPTLVS